MRYALTDDEWIAIKSMLPNKPRGVPRVNDRRVLNGTLAGCDPIIHAGDIGSPDVLARLGALAPVHAVRGSQSGFFQFPFLHPEIDQRLVCY
jgi:hypothetical protein